MTRISITYDNETVILAANLAQASAPLEVDGVGIGQQTADARHRTDIAVALAARFSWPEGDWPEIPFGSIADDWAENSEAWDELEYETHADADEDERP